MVCDETYSSCYINKLDTLQTNKTATTFAKHKLCVYIMEQKSSN